MSLAAGARLGPYEIVSPLGAGGMGEVYRAKDARLNRTVAIKILSEESATDADRRERFEREAKAISALDHPNICALYDVGDHDGTYFLVMPCLEGESLAERLRKGPIAPEQAIKHAIEIATALDAAHRHGIIHRDLKPGNVMLTKTGVKLLDFGLAKLKKAEGPLGHTTMAKGTGIGTLLGTMPYMSPEQVEGREVDARSDIFSLGAVIFEMVTGQRAFKGETAASVIGAIMKDDPPAIRTVQPLAPVALDQIVTTCLAKDPDERWQSSADIARTLKWVVSLADLSATPRRRRTLWPAAMAALVIAAIGVTAWPALRPAETRPQIVRFPLVPPANATFSGTRASVPIVQMAVSPDGRTVAFVAAEGRKRPSLWVRPLDDVTSKPLPGTDNASDPFWAPDSTAIGFFADGRLKRVNVTSGQVQDICEAPFSMRGASWSTDGTIVFGDVQSGLSRVPASGGPVTALPIEGVEVSGNSQRWPVFLPDGRHFLYYQRGDADRRGIYVASIDGGTPKRVLETTLSALYANGRLLVVKDTALLAYPFDYRTGEITGDSVTVASQMGGSSTGQAPMSVSQTGVLMYGGGMAQQNQLQWFDRSGKPLGRPLQTGNFANFSLSPDEATLVMSRVDPLTNTSDVWLLDLQRSTPTRLTLDPMNDLGAVWSPDGTGLVFRSDRSGGNHLLGFSLVGGAREEDLIQRDISNPTSWSSDGKYLLYHATLGRTGMDIGAIQMSDHTLQPVVNTRFNEYDGRFSPDGKWIAYVSEESGAAEVYVQPFPPTGEKWPVSANGGAEPRWRGDGRELFYIDPDRRLISVPVQTAGQFKPGVASPLFQTGMPEFAVSYRSQLEVSRDGQRFLINSGAEDSAYPPISIVLNWTTMLARESRR